MHPFSAVVCHLFLHEGGTHFLTSADIMITENLAVSIESSGNEITGTAEYSDRKIV